MASFKYLTPASRSPGLQVSQISFSFSRIVSRPRRLYSTMEKEEVFNPRFVVVSLGNPAPHAESLHSTGHLALQSLQQQLNCEENSQPQFSSERIAKKATRASVGDKYTLLQCPTLMNISGPWVAKAWRQILGDAKDQDPDRPLGLIIVSDDLEEDMAIVKVRKWDKSHRGHNGLKSIMASMKPADYKDSKWARISVGIGRPEDRDHGTVSDYVLRPWSKYQKEMLAKGTGPGVLAALKEIEAAWRIQKEKPANGAESKDAKQVMKGKKGAKGRKQANVENIDSLADEQMIATGL